MESFGPLSSQTYNEDEGWNEDLFFHSSRANPSLMVNAQMGTTRSSLNNNIYLSAPFSLFEESLPSHSPNPNSNIILSRNQNNNFPQFQDISKKLPSPTPVFSSFSAPKLLYQHPFFSASSNVHNITSDAPTYHEASSSSPTLYEYNFYQPPSFSTRNEIISTTTSNSHIKGPSPSNNNITITSSSSSSYDKFTKIKKRKRQSKGPTTANACEQCRSKHTKCDGNAPCHKCRKNGQECTYKRNKRKRGPEPGKLKKLEDLVSILSNKISQPISDGETALHLTNAYPEYVRSFTDHLAPFTGIKAHYNEVFQEGPSSLFHMYTVLANGALSLGHREVAQQFIICARSILPQVFDESNFLTAAGYSLMSSYYSHEGDVDKSANCIALSQKMLKTLLSSSSFSDSIFSTYIHAAIRGAHLAAVKYCDSRMDQINRLTNMLNDIEYYPSLPEDMETASFQKAVGLLLKGVIESGFTNNCLQSLQNIETVQNLQFSSNILFQINNILILAYKTLFYFINKQFDLAAINANKVTDLLSTISDFGYPIFCILVVGLFEVHSVLENHEKAQQTLQFGENLAKNFAIMERWLNSIYEKQVYSRPYKTLLPTLRKADFQINIQNDSLS